ncbi:acyl-CoA dehydrogenase family protein [Sporosarcina sp. FSL W7-1349]|uniref:acyl-CoA dehydrogenase family protein n=1 Tax=Sporosarcina sp. FSL W7-1349 TaxID=2921561 RepID=UPI0030F693F7
MDFSLTEIQEVFKSTAKKLFEEKWDITTLRAIEKEERGFSSTFYKEIADLGFLGLIVPEDYGGVGGGLTDLAVIVEEAGSALFPSPFLPTVTYGVLPLLKYGTEAQKQELLPKIIEGKVIVSSALSEAQAHYDMRYISTSAKKLGGGYTLSGTKLFAPFADSADYLLTLARTGPGQEGSADGLSLFLVKNDPSTVRHTPLKSIGSDGLYEVEFLDTPLTDADLLGAEGAGWSVVQEIIELATALQSVEMAGLLGRALDLTNNYVKERTQFNQPIGNFQSVQHRLSDMYTVVEGGKLAAFQAIWRLEEGLPAEKEIAVAKAWLSKEGQKVLVGAHQLHGGMGVDMDYPLQFCFRRFKSMQLNLGPAANHLKRLGRTFIQDPVAQVVHS